MNKKIILLLLSSLLVSPVFSSNRATTWSEGNTLTAAALNGEFNNIYAGNISRTAGYWSAEDNIPVCFGSSGCADVRLEWDATQTQDNFQVGLGGSNTIHIIQVSDIATNFGLAAMTNPALVVQSADEASTEDFVLITHDQTNGVLNVGSGALDIRFGDYDGGTTDVGRVSIASATGNLTFEGATDDAYETTLAITDPTTADKTVTLSNNSLTVAGMTTPTATDHAVIRADGTSGALIQGSTVIIDDSDNVSGIVNLTLTGTTTLGGVAYTWPAADGTNGYALTTNGAGTMSWTAAGGGGATTLAGLTDTTIASSEDNDFLAYDSTSGNYINQSYAEAGLGALAVLATVNNGQWSGTDLAVANGGTGLSTFGGTNHVLYTTAAAALASEAAFVYDNSADTLDVPNLNVDVINDSGAAEITVNEDVSINAAKYLRVDEIRFPTSNTDLHIIYNDTVEIAEFSISDDIAGVVLGDAEAYKGMLRLQTKTYGAQSEHEAGLIYFEDEAVTPVAHFVWVDTSNILRIHTSDPGATDTAGTVVGLQTSWYDVKDVYGEADPLMALTAILNTPVYNWKYRNSTYQNQDGTPQTFTGIVGYDKDDWYLMNTGPQQTPAMNSITMHGYSILAIQALYDKIERLEAQLHASGN